MDSPPSLPAVGGEGTPGLGKGALQGQEELDYQAPQDL